jgi:protein gp37
MYPGWARGIRNQCQDAGIPFYFKQRGEWIGFDDLGDLAYHLKECKPKMHCWSDRRCSYRVGKKAAGRTLYGREWNEFPKA